MIRVTGMVDRLRRMPRLTRKPMIGVTGMMNRTVAETGVNAPDAANTAYTFA